ncbi:hypothetical protein K505DRAFT_326090 [Melanomma pulvis-pyrius CBS 109.77]|uniref:Uncharacterized protein n=1 Tax=Melanomma pulvis-pyrius CBS 109.77 TaxID=1314802 RepID=A0A6A6X882_9PLEO|nr:hypothetical protein K505DRAFT_326090 [Melanomma pulvis-pyrius CBS 109.77]
MPPVPTVLPSVPTVLPSVPTVLPPVPTVAPRAHMLCTVVKGRWLFYSIKSFPKVGLCGWAQSNPRPPPRWRAVLPICQSL